MNPEKCSAEKRALSREDFILDALTRNEAPCIFILEQDVDLLLDRYDVESKSGLSGIDELALFLAYGSTKKETPFYLVIHNIDQIGVNEQSDFFALARDRKMMTKPALMDDIVIVFTVSSIKGTPDILYSFWNFGVDLIHI